MGRVRRVERMGRVVRMERTVRMGREQNRMGEKEKMVTLGGRERVRKRLNHPHILIMAALCFKLAVVLVL